MLALGFGLLLVALWVNRFYPGLVVAFVGILLNGIVILINDGYMPIWATSLEAAGLTAPTSPVPSMSSFRARPPTSS